MYLTRTTDSLIVTPDNTQQVDVYAAWTDEEKTSSGVGPASTSAESSVNAITSGSATTVIPANKPRGTIRRLSYFGAKAPLSNSALVTVRVRISDGTTTIDLFSAPLNPGDQLTYTEDRGFFVTPASGLYPTTADLVQQFIDALALQGQALPAS